MKNKILIDTTYLLPLFGIEIEKFNLRDIQSLLEVDAEIIYNSISLIEIKWIILKLAKKNKKTLEQMRDTYNETLEYLSASDEIKQTPLITPKIIRLEDKLSDLGVNDYFDRIITATAKIYANIFLTEDKKLAKQIKTMNEFKDLTILNWQQFREQE